MRDLGTDGANLSHLWRAVNLVKYRNYRKCSQIPKDHALGHSLDKLQLMMLSQWVGIIISLLPIFE